MAPESEANVGLIGGTVTRNRTAFHDPAFLGNKQGTERTRRSRKAATETSWVPLQDNSGSRAGDFSGQDTSSAAKSLSHKRLAIAPCCILQQETAFNHLLTKHLGDDKEKCIFSLIRKSLHPKKQMKAFIVLLNHFQASIFLQCLFRSRLSWVCSLYSSKIHFGFSSSRMCSIPYLRARTMASSQSISNS